VWARQNGLILHQGVRVAEGLSSLVVFAELVPTVANSEEVGLLLISYGPFPTCVNIAIGATSQARPLLHKTT